MCSLSYSIDVWKECLLRTRRRTRHRWQSSVHHRLLSFLKASCDICVGVRVDWFLCIERLLASEQENLCTLLHECWIIQLSAFTNSLFIWLESLAFTGEVLEGIAAASRCLITWLTLCWWLLTLDWLLARLKLCALWSIACLSGTIWHWHRHGPRVLHPRWVEALSIRIKWTWLEGILHRLLLLRHLIWLLTARKRHTALWMLILTVIVIISLMAIVPLTMIATLIELRLVVVVRLLRWLVIVLHILEVRLLHLERWSSWWRIWPVLRERPSMVWPCKPSIIRCEWFRHLHLRCWGIEGGRLCIWNEFCYVSLHCCCFWLEGIEKLVGFSNRLLREWVLCLSWWRFHHLIGWWHCSLIKASLNDSTWGLHHHLRWCWLNLNLLNWLLVCGCKKSIRLNLFG